MYADSWGRYVVCYCTECCNFNYHHHHHNSTMSSYPYNYCQQFEESPTSSTNCKFRRSQLRESPTSSINCGFGQTQFKESPTPSTNCGFGRSYTKLSVKKSTTTYMNEVSKEISKGSKKLKKKISKTTKKVKSSKGSGRSNARDTYVNSNSSQLDQVNNVDSSEYIATLNGNNVRMPLYNTVQNMASRNSGSITSFITKNGLPLTSETNTFKPTNSSEYPFKYNTRNKNNSPQYQNRNYQNYISKSNINFLEQDNSKDNVHKIQRSSSQESHDFQHKPPYKSHESDFPNSNHSSYCCLIPGQNSNCSVTKSDSYIGNPKCLPKFSNKCNCCNCSLKPSKQFSNSNKQPSQNSRSQQPYPAFKNKPISVKSNPQLDVINEETEAEDISNYNFNQKPNPSNSGPFENLKKTMKSNASPKSFEDSCDDFLNIICDSILESVEKSLDTKLKDYCSKTMEKLECLNCKLDKNERKMEQLQSDLMEKISIQNEMYQQQFSLLFKFLVENNTAKEKHNIKTYKDKESQCNIEDNAPDKNNKIFPIEDTAPQNNALPKLSTEMKSVATNVSFADRSSPTVSTHKLRDTSATKVLRTISSPEMKNAASLIRNSSNSNICNAVCIRSSQSHNPCRNLECLCTDNEEECVKGSFNFDTNAYRNLKTSATSLPQNLPISRTTTESATLITCRICQGSSKTCICPTKDIEERQDIYTEDENRETSGYITDPDDSSENEEGLSRKKLKKKVNKNKKQRTDTISTTPGSGKSKDSMLSDLKHNDDGYNTQRSLKSRSPTRLSRL